MLKNRQKKQSKMLKNHKKCLENVDDVEKP